MNVTKETKIAYLVGLVGSGGSNLALLPGGELGEIAVVVTLPILRNQSSASLHTAGYKYYAHLVVEDSGLASLGLGDQSLIKNIENIFADLLQLKLDLGTVLMDSVNVVIGIGTLGLLLLLDGGNNAPRSTAGANNVLVGDREKVTLIDSKLATDLR